MSQARLADPVSWTHRSELIFLVCQRTCMNPGPEGLFSMLLIVARGIRCQNLPARNEAKIKCHCSAEHVVRKYLDERRGSPPVGTVSRARSSRRYALAALTRRLCTASLLPYITMSLQRFLVVFEGPPCISSHKGFCGV